LEGALQLLHFREILGHEPAMAGNLATHRRKEVQKSQIIAVHFEDQGNNRIKNIETL
jgi:hypothetical protein